MLSLMNLIFLCIFVATMANIGQDYKKHGSSLSSRLVEVDESIDRRISVHLTQFSLPRFSLSCRLEEVEDVLVPFVREMIRNSFLTEIRDFHNSDNSHSSSALFSSITKDNWGDLNISTYTMLSSLGHRQAAARRFLRSFARPKHGLKSNQESPLSVEVNMILATLSLDHHVSSLQEHEACFSSRLAHDFALDASRSLRHRIRGLQSSIADTTNSSSRKQSSSSASFPRLCRSVFAWERNGHFSFSSLLSVLPDVESNNRQCLCTPPSCRKVLFFKENDPKPGLSIEWKENPSKKSQCEQSSSSDTKSNANLFIRDLNLVIVFLILLTLGTISFFFSDSWKAVFR